jgi:hypothetical protein
MTAANHILAGIAVPRGMLWADEFDWVPVDRATTYSVTGALIVDVAARLAGRPITLAGEVDAGWLQLGVLRQLHALAGLPDATHTLELADGRTFTVMFAPDTPIEAKPIGRPELPSAANPYYATLRLIEV